MINLLLPRRRAYVQDGEWARIRRWSAIPAEKDCAFIREWEEAVAAFVKVPQAVAVNSGRAGMTLILRHLGIGAGDEVIVPAYTLKDLLPLIQDLGAAVIPADVDCDTLNVTADSIAARITPRTKAVIVLHAFGAPAPMTQILECTQSRGIPVIEDCAHALGACLDGQPVGGFGYAAFYSFEPTKPVNTYGGGMVVSRDERLVTFIREEEAGKTFDISGVLKKVGATRREQLLMGAGLAWPVLLLMTSDKAKSLVSAAYRRAQGVPASSLRYAPLQARIGLEKLASLPERLEQRRVLAEAYRSFLPSSVRLQSTLENAEPTWYFCVALLPVPARTVRPALLFRGVDTAVEDEIADNCAGLLGYGDCPNTAASFPRAMALPMFDGMDQGAARRVARAITRLLPR